MRGILAGTALLLVTLTPPAAADDAVKEGRSVGVAATCSNDKLVCAILKTGQTVPTSECNARQSGAVRIVPGDCYDED